MHCKVADLPFWDEVAELTPGCGKNEARFGVEVFDGRWWWAFFSSRAHD